MRAGLRWKLVLLSGGLLVGAGTALAQSAPEPTSNTPASDAIGPQELQNFSLPGTPTKTAEQPKSIAPVAKSAVPDTPAVKVAAEPSRAPSSRELARRESRQALAAPPRRSSTTPPASPAVAPPSSYPLANPVAAPPALPLPQTAKLADAAPTVTVAPERHLSILPWLLAALAIAAGTIFVFWRRNQQREVIAGPPELSRFVAPEPKPAAPAPASRGAAPISVPLPAGAPSSVPQPGASPPRGIVASRLRPSLELGLQPLRCLVDDDQVTIEFEVELFNSGTAPARAVIAEASLFNASASQDQELAAFYAKPPGAGDRIDSIPPMRRMTFTNRVVAPRAALQEYELAGRKAFVPVLAFNTQYEWSGGRGQSSLAFLLGRETRGDKLGPLHLDGAHREVRGLAAHVLPTAVRT